MSSPIPFRGFCASASRFRRSVIGLVLVFGVLPLSALPAGAATASSSQNPFCSRLGKSIQASSGAQMFCFGPQLNGAATGGLHPSAQPFGPNVNAANPHEDISPSGVQAFGQSETSVGAVGPYVVEAWNDSTAFFSPCPSPMNKEEGTGFGFSANAGASFTDKGGLPNSNCNVARYGGDPSVEAWQPGGSAYFYVSSLFNGPAGGGGKSFLALAACKATGTGASASIGCSQPIIVAASTQCATQNGFTFCSFLDKDFLSIDPQRGRLYLSYTEFGIAGASVNGQVELAVCDIGTASGGTGPAGGTAGKPVCRPNQGASPYLTVAAPNANCEQEGAYPAVDVATGDVYVALEFNWATNIFNPACFTSHTANVLSRVPAACLTLTPVSPCAGPSASTSVNITSMDAAFIPGYNRFPMNDFPRIAVDHATATVSIVWNDARFHPSGDILLQSYKIGTLVKSQATPVRINASAGGWNFLPALRQADNDNRLNVSWYQRSSANTALTDVFATAISPLSTTPASETRVTTVTSDWNAVSSDIVPNFGDYTDNYIRAIPSAPYVTEELYVAWSDGRLGDPQPFNSLGELDADSD